MSEQAPTNQERTLTLSDEMDAFLVKLAEARKGAKEQAPPQSSAIPTSPALTTNNLGWPSSGRQTCIICHTRRFDPDPTGFTCGLPACIQEFVSVVDGNADLRDAFNRFCSESLGYDVDDPDSVFDKLKEDLKEVDTLGSEIEEIAKALGLKTTDGAGNDIPTAELIQQIAAEVINIKNSFAKVVEQLNSVA